MFAAVLDTCVLYSGLRRDLLLTMSAQGVYRVVLSEDLLFEIQYVEAGKLRKLGVAGEEAELRADHLVANLRDAFEVLDPRRVNLVRDVGLPDPNDEHVVATALAGGADVVVTDNLRHFPEELLPDGLRVQGPSNFLHDMVTAHPHDAVRALLEGTSCCCTASPRSPARLRWPSPTRCMAGSTPTPGRRGPARFSRRRRPTVASGSFFARLPQGRLTVVQGILRKHRNERKSVRAAEGDR